MYGQAEIGTGQAEDIHGVKEDGTGEGWDIIGMMADGFKPGEDTDGTGDIGDKRNFDFGIYFNISS